MSVSDTTAPVPAAGEGRSLWQDAWRRLRRNKAAVLSALVLAVVILAAVFGPYVVPHAYDTVYSNYVRTPASLEPYPRADAIEPEIRAALRRARVDIASIAVADGVATVEVTSEREIDPRVTRYLERSDLFTNGAVQRLSDDRRSATLTADVQQFHFYLGTDGNGRDMLARILVATRVSLAIGILATAVALVIGVTYGAVAGYFGGKVDDVMMRIVDVLYSLPFIFFVIMLVVFFGRNFVLMFIAVGAIEWLDMARIVRGQTLALKRREFVQAAEALGVENAGILKRHIIPNTLGPVVIYMTLMVPRVIILESFLSFLGLGVQEPLTSLGVLIAEGARNIEGATWLLVYPAITLALVLFALNFLGDGLRDALDPKDR
ncbi:ABC transporter permease [Chthonobacter rhizosphaerae]|uniref:ABC transporter permease n=1 Tax=Chthonobacter rhizosphaerae TaxID=2735553 RepID=UPI0015EFB18C|nr:ABC transporter permease subunit [Chthonobacter rhizosphaerae]